MQFIRKTTGNRYSKKVMIDDTGVSVSSGSSSSMGVTVTSAELEFKNEEENYRYILKFELDEAEAIAFSMLQSIHGTRQQEREREPFNKQALLERFKLYIDAQEARYKRR